MVKMVNGCLLSAIFGWLLTISAIIAQEGKPPQPVKVNATLSPVDSQGRQTLTLKLTIEKGWHVYANPAGANGPVPTTVQVSANAPLAHVQVEYPPGKAKMQAGETFRVYEGAVEIRVVVQRGQVNGQLDTSPLAVALRYQACNDQICLPPRTIKLTVQP